MNSYAMGKVLKIIRSCKRIPAPERHEIKREVEKEGVYGNSLYFLLTFDVI